jgi:AcrR family transcriptional regulator
MGRRPNPQRKQDLLDEIVVYLGENGIGDLSLRPLARHLGTSTYTLTYQFGSKDQLLSDAVGHAVQLQVAATEDLVGPEGTAAELVSALWGWALQPDNLKLVRMLLEATTLAASQPDLFGAVGARAMAEGRSLLVERLSAAGLDDGEAETVATGAWACLVGLQIDLLASGDRSRIARGVEQLCRSLDEAAGAVPEPAPGAH